MKSNLFQNRLSILSILPFLLLSILISSTSTSALTSSAAQSGQLDFHLQRIGVPITDHARIEPRFHRIQRQGQDPNDREGHKGQTAIYTAGRASGGVTTIAAINPRNGGVVWRQVLEPTDPIKAFFTTADVILTLSGPTASNVRLHHALTGYLLWEAPPTNSSSLISSTSTLDLLQASKHGDDSESSLDLGFDAHFMKGVGDILVISDNGKLLRRLEAKTGREIFSYSLETEQAGEEREEQLIRVVSSHSNIFLVSIKKVKVGLISKETQYVLTSHVLTLGGKHLKSFNLPAQILGGASDVVLTPLSASSQYLTPPSQDGTSSSMIPPLVPHLSWLQKDGSIHFLPLYYNENLSENDIKDKIQTIKSKESDTRFFKIKEIVGAAHHRGLIVGLRNDGRAEFIKISNLPKSLKDYESTIKSVFASEEEAHDAIHSGFTDKKNQAFICRVFFTRNQQLLNFHIFWVDASNGEGQVSGYSFQWDHDLNGNIQSVSFEVSMMSPYQLVNRASLVTSSGSLRMIQEDQHQWILEESLSQVKKNLMIDLPEKKLIGGGNVLDSNATSASSSTTKNSQINALGNEGPVGRILRHISYLSEVPSYLISNAAKLSSITSYKDIFTVTFSAQRAPAIPSIPGEPAVPLKPPPSAKPKAANKPKSEADISHSSMAPRYTNSSYTTLFRDDFGFRKLLVSATDTGKLYAQDLGARGKFVWEKSLIGFGQGEGSPEPNIKVLDMFMTRSLGDAQELKVESNTLEEVSDASLINPMKADSNAPIISILAEQSILKAAVVTTVFELDPLTGKFVDDATTGIPLFIGKTQDVFLLPVRDEETGQRVIAAVDKDEKLHIHPSSPSAIKALQALSPNFYFTLQSTTKTSTSSYSSLTGYSTAGNALTNGNPAIKVWKHDFLPGEKIVDTKDFNRDAIASLGKVRGDRSTLYKYLNVNSKLVTTLISHDNSELDELEATSSLTGYEARIYLIDTISGKILYQTQIEDVDPINGVKTNFVENWITASYSVRNQDEGLSNRLISIELYDSNSDDQTWNWKGFFSSFGKVSSSTSQKSQLERKSKNANPTLSEIEKEELNSLNLPLSFSQTFILPYRVRSLGSTSTKFGITSKSLLVSNDRDQLISIPRRFLDPRRVVGRKQTQLDMEETLLPYDPLIPNEPKWIVSHFYSVADVQNIVSSPALLESTSLVLGYGLDTFSTRLTPSNTFDLLSENFNKPQLLLTIVALSIGIFLTRPMVKSKILSARWK